MTRPHQIVEVARLFDRYFREEMGDDQEAEEAYAYDLVHGIGWETGSRCDANQLMLDAMEELGHEPPEDWPAGQSIECKEFDLIFETAWLLAIVLGTK